MTWHTTGNVAKALAGGYIGEAIIMPRPLSFEIHSLLTGERLPIRTIYYYGERDERMSGMFGYANRSEMREAACAP